MNPAAFIMELLFPAECVACGEGIAKGALCGACRMGIAPHGTAFCGACGAALPGFRNLCHPCTPYLLGAAANYSNEKVRALVHALKFGGLRGAAAPLADILSHYAARLPIDFRGFVVVPVPISRERIRERGFNQSALIAERFAEFLGLPMEPALLARIAHRTAQSDIADRAMRRENIKGCYESKRIARRAKIVLVDDVTTSGATFTEAASTLRTAGAGKILALAAAKAI